MGSRRIKMKLTLTKKQLDILSSILFDTVDSLEDDLIGIDGENESIEDFEAYKIYQQIKTLQNFNKENN
jgi:hypothetical protein